MTNKTGIGSYPADEPESGPSDDADTGAAPGSNKGDLASDPDRIQKKLDRYREEMVEDAPASSSPEDNP